MHTDATPDIPLKLTSRRLAGRTVIAIRGELDIASAAALRGHLANAIHHTTNPLVFDLSGVPFCDAAGLDLLVGAHRQASARGVDISLAAPRPQLINLLRITGLDGVFTLHGPDATTPDATTPDHHDQDDSTAAA
ncbi:MAG TPA: STAS domain-containing protein [Actinomadura sp.]|jgi:anti-sigma B factor antagonist|nr:STAS domain-containing protein [Actinomadura sp.]